MAGHRLAIFLARFAMADGQAFLCARDGDVEQAAFLGHLFPVWLGGKGGKGVATFLGILLALSFPVGLAACATWAAAALVTRISSLSALVSAATAFLWAALLGHGEMVILIVLLATFVFWRHLPNIERLKAGTEPRIGAKK